MNLLLITLVLFLAIIATRISNRAGLPSLLLFLTLGVIFSCFGFDFNNFKIAEDIATISLMIIMFYGGFGTGKVYCKRVNNFGNSWSIFNCNYNWIFLPLYIEIQLFGIHATGFCCSINRLCFSFKYFSF